MSIKKDEKTGLYTLQFYYRDHNGKRHHPKKTGFKRIKDAEAYQRDFLARINNVSGISFKALAAQYLKDSKARVKPTTYQTKKAAFDNHLIPYFSNILIDDITPGMVRDFQTKYITASGLKDTTLHYINQQLSAVFNYGAKFYGLKDNPVKLAGTMGKVKSGRLDFYTPEEFEKVLACLSDPSDHALILFLFWSGCRIGEALALNWDDFSLEDNSVSITKNLQYAEGRGYYISSPKTEKSKRVILLPAFVLDELQAYKAQLYGYKDNQRLFPKSFSGVRYAFHVAADHAGVKRIRLHDLRHSHASMLINLGASPLLVSQRLGHENAEMTLRIYAHLFPNEQEKMRTLLEKFGQNLKSAENV